MRHLAIGLVFLSFSGCGEKQPAATNVADRVATFADDDPKMNAAIVRARETVDRFIDALKSPGKSRTGFSIKAPFPYGSSGGAEHIWLTPVTFDGKNFMGEINNEPEKVTNVKLGDKATIPKAEISDWMYLENGRLVGGETMRVLRDSLSPAEREQFDQSVPFKMD